MCDGIIFRSQVHGQHMACLISSLDMNNIFKAKVLEDLQDSGSSTTEPKAQEAWQKLPCVLDGKNCYAQEFKKPGKNYQLHSIQHLLLIGVAWFRETIRSYPFFRMYPRKTSGMGRTLHQCETGRSIQMLATHSIYAPRTASII
ncbi:uncharacterized protein [Lolium perenne]|uniref:uncharacterized protein isoform X2 n=1 Tax=Lolium perenne TaxID=4522 RepID=UPI0021F535A1|nr:uncharacterized protein LOC127342683 isoform X2 [Lolium perenne]